MLNEERIVREILDSWKGGASAVKAAWRDHAAPDLLWWNSARGGLRGIEQCEAGIDAMFTMLNVASTKAPIRKILAGPGVVFVERSDDMYLEDGSLLVAIPVTGVIEFDGDKIVEWRDYCDDWMDSFRPEDAPRALASPASAE